MKIHFENADDLQDGISLVADELGITVSDKSDADYTVVITESRDNGLELDLNSTVAKITYGGGKTRFFRALAIFADAVRNNKTVKKTTQNPVFKTNGAMIDMSRNAVMKPDTVKFLLRKIALMGMNTFMLYTEDTYEIDNRPYFGHLRGRYTKDEIRDIDSYAQKLGIELVPCIQVLGHLETMLRWNTASAYRDTSNVMLVGAEETYSLINDMLRTVSEMFTSKKLHIGMDETHNLGTGKYADINGFRDRQDIFFEHLDKVVEMAKSYGFEPMMWSDMFFRMSGKGLKGLRDYDLRIDLPSDIGKKVPGGVRQVFWDYYNPEKEFYSINIEKHKQLGTDTLFAGGVWAWSGFAVQYSRSIRNSVPALDACKESGIRDIFATVWHNGSDCNLIMSLPGLALYADYDYTGHYNEHSVEKSFKTTCNAEYSDFIRTEAIEYPNRDNSLSGTTRVILYNDPLLGIVDKHFETFDLENYYKELSASLKYIGTEDNFYKPAFDVIKALCSLLENKADFGIRLKKAYDNNDKSVLLDMSVECDTVIEKLYTLKQTHKKAWIKYNKAFGWEVHDIRYGGLISRFETVKERLSDYLAGKIPEIEELKADRLRIDGAQDTEPPINKSFLWSSYKTLATAGIL